MSEAAIRIKQKALAAAQPLNVHLELTYACNWRCVFCYNPRHFDRRRLDAAEWAAVLDDLRALGTMTVTLTGGEPLAHPEFFEIAQAVRERHFALRVFTNASLIDDAAADKLAALLPLAVEVSIHGATAEVHDRTTGKPGSFDAALGGVRRLRARNVNVIMKTPVTRGNEHQLDEIIALAASLDLPLQLDPHLTPKDDGDVSPVSLTASVETLRHIAELAHANGGDPFTERTRGGSNCGLGRITLAVDPEGNVYPCMQWRHRSIANVRETRLRDAWHTSPVRIEAAAASVAANDRLLDSGGAIGEFPYCPALAMQETGDPLTPDANFELRAAIAAEVRSRRAS